MTTLLRWGPLIVLGALFGLGVYRSIEPTTEGTEYRSEWVAARALPANHQIRPGDLVYPREWLAAGRLLLQDTDPNGKHLIGPRRKGERIHPDQISSRPDLTPRAANSQVYLYVLKDDTTPAGGWTPGASAIPCYQKPKAKPSVAGQRPVCIHTPLRILAIHVGTSTSEVSWLALEVPEALRCTFAQFALADKRMLFQVPSK